MSRLNHKKPNVGYLKVKREASFSWDEKEGAFFIQDKVAKKRYGPFPSIKDAFLEGYEFCLDTSGWKRRERKADFTQQTREAVAA